LQNSFCFVLAIGNQMDMVRHNDLSEN
jgi:hypothetical protein